jgi:hypothetical protein
MSDLIKVMMFFKKKDGLSDEEFKDHYENEHTALFEKYLELPGVERYVRRYLAPIADTISGETRSSGFDVVTEVWFSDPKLFESFRQGTLYPEDFRQLIAADEATFFDRENIYWATLDEHDSKLPQH